MEDTKKDTEEKIFLKMRDMKLSTIYKFLLIFWMIDFLTTIFALNFCDNLIESNKLSAYFFNLGWYGWLIVFVYTIFTLFLFTLYIKISSNYLKRKNKNCSLIYTYFAVIFFCILELLVIINNLILILNKL